MKDQRFIELLNLYLDQQISEFEAAELEAEVTKNPERRRTYNQYCRLQRACAMLGEGAREQAAGKEKFLRSLQAAEKKIARPRNRPLWRSTYAYAGAFGATAMAACVALMMSIGGRQAPAISTVVSADRPDVARVEARASTAHSEPVFAVSLASMPRNEVEPQPALSAAGLSVARNARELEIAANDREALEWMQRVELLPVQRIDLEEPVFETNHPTLHPDNRVFRSRRSLQTGNAEFTAFQFQR